MDAHFGRPQGPMGMGEEVNIVWALAQPMIRILRMMLAAPGEPNEISGNELSATEKKDGPSSTVCFKPPQILFYLIGESYFAKAMHTTDKPFIVACFVELLYLGSTHWVWLEAHACCY